MLHDFYDALNLLYKSENWSLCKRTASTIFILSDYHIKRTSLRDIMRIATQEQIPCWMFWEFCDVKTLCSGLIGAGIVRTGLVFCQGVTYTFLIIIATAFFPPYPCLSMRASRTLNRIKLLREQMNGAVIGLRDPLFSEKMQNIKKWKNYE